MTEENVLQDPSEEGSEERFKRAGEILASARQAAGFSLEQVSDRLKISVPYLKALESCHYDQLPGTTFVRGYLRSYARLVELDEEHVLSLFGETVQADEQVARLLREKPLDHHGAPGGRWLTAAALVLLAAFVAGSVYWWNADTVREDAPVTARVAPVIDSELAVVDLGENQEDSVSENASESSVDITTLVPVQDTAPAENVPVEVSFIEVSPAETTPVITPVNVPELQNPEPITEVAPVLTVAQVDEEDRLLVRFSGDCWVEVRDSEGNVLFSDLKPGQSELSLAGDGPLRVVFGNVNAVTEVLFNGEPVELDVPVSRSGIGRLTLG